jgi:hypothetical protein
MIEAKNKEVEFFFIQKYGSLPEELWHHEGIVGDIIRDVGADLLRSTVFRTSITCDYDNNDPQFKTDMPDEVWATMTHCLQIDPSSDRIIEDIEGFPRVLDIIIDYRNHSGWVVPDMNFSIGRRAVNHVNRRVLNIK